MGRMVIVVDRVAPPDSANTANLAVFAESGGATIASESVDDAVAPPDSANAAKLAVFAKIWRCAVS